MSSKSLSKQADPLLKSQVDKSVDSASQQEKQPAKLKNEDEPNSKSDQQAPNLHQQTTTSFRSGQKQMVESMRSRESSSQRVEIKTNNRQLQRQNQLDDEELEQKLMKHQSIETEELVQSERSDLLAAEDSEEEVAIIELGSQETPLYILMTNDVGVQVNLLPSSHHFDGSSQELNQIFNQTGRSQKQILKQLEERGTQMSFNNFSNENSKEWGEYQKSSLKNQQQYKMAEKRLSEMKQKDSKTSSSPAVKESLVSSRNGEF